MSMTHRANGAHARARAHDARHRQALRRGQGAHRRRLLGQRGRGRRAHRRQRRRQVHAREGARRGACPGCRLDRVRRRARARSHSPADAQDLGIATVFQDLALCDNLDVVANLWLGRELVSGSTPRRGRHGGAHLDAAARARREDPLGAHPGRLALGRSAPDRRDRPLAHRRAPRHHPRRAHRRPRRRADRRGAEPHRAPARARSRRDPDQPQHGRRHGRRRSRRGAAARAQQRRLQRRRRHERDAHRRDHRSGRRRPSSPAAPYPDAPSPSRRRAGAIARGKIIRMPSGRRRHDRRRRTATA